MKDNKEKIALALIILTLIFSLFTIYISSIRTSPPQVSAKASALYDPDNNEFVFEKNADLKLGMASTTKIMTAIVVIENSDLNKQITVDDRAIGVEGSSIYLKMGEELTIESLLYALMLRSANDAAAALAYEVCGSIESFCELMNAKVNELELKNTNFENPHGLDHQDHYTTAHDLAIITAYALSNPIFKEIVSTKSKKIESSMQTRLLLNHNKLLLRYEGCIGVKTGYTKKCGRTLVSAAERNSHTLIAVTLNAPNDWSDHTKLLDFGFSSIFTI